MEPAPDTPVPRTLDLSGLEEPVARAVTQLVEVLRGKVLPPPGAPRLSLRGIFAEPGKTIPPELIDEARAEMWADFPRDLPEPAAGS